MIRDVIKIKLLDTVSEEKYILKIDISTLEIVYTFYRNRKQLKGFDIVQIINEFPIRSTPFIEKKLLRSGIL